MVPQGTPRHKVLGRTCDEKNQAHHGPGSFLII
jgi:hypothetical protein